MAQVNGALPNRVMAYNLQVAVAQSGNTDLLEVVVDSVAVLGIDIAVTTNALDAFIIQGKMSPNTAYQTLYNAAADFTSPFGAVIDASGDLTTLAAAGSGWVLLNVLGFYSIKVQASCASGAGVVDIGAMGKG